MGRQVGISAPASGRGVGGQVGVNGQAAFGLPLRADGRAWMRAWWRRFGAHAVA